MVLNTSVHGPKQAYMNTRQTLKVLILEDDPLIAADIKGLLSDWGYRVIGTPATYAEALAVVSVDEPDLLIADIQIPGEKDGIDTTSELLELHKIPVIFLTGQGDHETVQRAKQVSPSAYLLKPFDERSLHISIDIAMHHFYQNAAESKPATPNRQATQQPNKLHADQILIKGQEVFIKQNYRFVKLCLGEIIYLEADRNHTYVYALNQKLVVRLALSKVLEKCQNSQFVRIHRSYAINAQLVDSFNDYEVVVSGRTLPLSANHRDEFLQQFHIA
jgi:two-component system, response regulator PdtaR